MESRPGDFPVTSSSPCPFSNYWVNAFCWAKEIQNHQPWIAAYLDCSDNAARFRFVENFVAKVKKLDLNPKIVFRGKDAAKAEAIRQRGNRRFTAGDLFGALAAYNESIVNAPFQDKGCIVLALSNRSLVLFHLGRYAECIHDIDQAVMLGYPLDSVKKLLIRKAKAFLALSRPHAAICVLENEGNLLNVCSGSLDEISKLGGEMEEYSRLLALALEKQKEEDEGSQDKAGQSSKPDMTPTLSTGWNKKEEIKGIELCDGRSRKFSSLSAVVGLKSCGTRKPVAERDLNGGEVVLVEPTFVSNVDKMSWHSNCYSCLCWTDAPFPCRKCSTVVFCSLACASDPKAAFHARECDFWQSVYLGEEEKPRKSVADGDQQIYQFGIFALRMVLTKSAQEWFSLINEQTKDVFASTSRAAKPKYQQEDLMDVLWLASFDEAKGLEASRQRMTPLVAFVALFTVKVLEKEYFSGVTFGKKARRRFGGIVMRVIDFCRRNYCVVRDLLAPSFTEITYSSTALHPVYSLFGKSCTPNLYGVHCGDVLVVRARRPVRKGEALTIPQVVFQSFALFPRLQRSLLLRMHGFDECKCRACEEDWPQDEKLMADYMQGSCKFKCPVCSRVLGTLCSVMQRKKRLVGACSKCKSNGREFDAIIRQHTIHLEQVAATSPAVTMDERLARVRAMRSIFVEPCIALVHADKALQEVLCLGGNKRFFH